MMKVPSPLPNHKIDDHEGSSQVNSEEYYESPILDALENRSNYGEESEYPSSDIGINQSTDFDSFMHEKANKKRILLVNAAWNHHIMSHLLDNFFKMKKK
uniref:Uncharacterized protein n=1 Tax=Ananas comosus var. bracteatus TaxID=296719 RepID=A0A6V7NF03_ANACO|nr:unnamed protein product [Ananas comosus var. bracteatus]